MKKEEMSKKQVQYIQTKKTSISEVKKTVPKQLIPTKVFGWAFGGIFLVVVIIGMLSFPLGEMLGGNLDVSIKVGLPWTFLEFDLSEDTDYMPLRMWNLIFDLLIYLVIAYAINVAVNVFLETSFSKEFLQARRKRQIAPKLYKVKKPVQSVRQHL